MVVPVGTRVWLVGHQILQGARSRRVSRGQLSQSERRTASGEGDISVRARVDVDAPSRDGPSGAVRVPINPCERTSGKRGMLSYRIWACRALFCCLGKDFVVQGTRLASDLGFPEGPVVMPDGGIVFCDGNTGELLQWKDEQLSTFAQMGGSPWGALLGTDGAVYVTQGGNVPGSPDQSAIPGIQRVNPDGSIEMLAT